MSPSEPDTKRAIAFFDGQNLFHQAKDSFGYTFPNYDPISLARLICIDHDWDLRQVRFCTGVPDQEDNSFWHKFWTKKLLIMSRRGAFVYSRSLRYRNKTIILDDGTRHNLLTGDEKGIDVRIALDVIALAHAKKYDVALIFSQDQDLSEVAGEVRTIANEQQRWIKVVSAFPASPTSTNRRGINKTDWVRISKRSYDRCIDNWDYRPKNK